MLLKEKRKLQNVNIVKACNAFIRNLRLSAVMLLCVAGALLTTPQTGLAQVDPQDGVEQVDPQDGLAQIDPQDGLEQADPQDVVAQPPTVSSVAITSTAPTNGYYKAGDTIQATITFNESVNVTGTPQVTLNINGAKTASYTSGSGGTSLVFGYTVASGDADTDGVSIDAGEVARNGGTINAVDDATPATLTYPAVSTNASHKVDTSVPTVSSVAITSAPANNGVYKVGETIQATVTFSETMDVTVPPGPPHAPPPVPPQLTLMIGVAGKPAVYTRGSGTTQLVFEYTVVAGDEDTDGIEIAANQLSLNNGTITDGAGNAATLTHASLGAHASHSVDTVVPTVSGVEITSTPSNATYSTGDTIEATVTFDETVNVTGAPQLTLTIGTENKTASYTSGSGSTALIFGYTVIAGDEDTDGISIDGLSGTIADAAGNAADLTNTVLGAQASHKVDTTPVEALGQALGQQGQSPHDNPQWPGDRKTPDWGSPGGPIVGGPEVSSLAITSTAKTYKTDDKIQVTVTFSESVDVTGTPTLKLNIGGSGKTANYTSGSESTNLIFEYTVTAGDEDTDGIEIRKDALKLNGGTIKATSNQMDAHRGLGNYALTTPQSAHKVDGVAPTVATTDGIAITSSTNNNTYTTGETIEATVTFSENVTVTGTPTLTLNIGGQGKAANYTTTGSTTALIFGYTVVVGDTDTDGISIDADQLAFNGGTIKDSAGNDATLTHTALATQTSHKVETSQSNQQAPTVSSVAITSTATNGYYKTGDKIQATVTFSESVTVAGTPTLTLKVGTADKTANWTSGSPGTALVFEYTVASGDTDANGIEIAANKLSGTITATNGGAAANLNHTALATQTSHKVDTTAPTVAANGIEITSMPVSNKTYKKGETISVKVTFSEDVNVTGTPQLTLNIGDNEETANWTSGSGTDTLVFGYTVASGDEDTDGIEIEADKLSGTIKDSAGNAATLTHDALTTQALHKVDGTTTHNIEQPTISSVAITSSAGEDNTYKIGDTIEATVTFSKTVTVTGTPQLTLKVGTVDKTADYGSGSTTTALVFAYTVVSGDTDTDGISIAANQLDFNGGTIRDADDNNATRTHTALPTQTSHKVEGVIPTVVPNGVDIISTPQNGSTYKAGETIEATVTFNESVIVTGTPHLRLTIGTGPNANKTANYLNGTNTTKLQFDYTVVDGDVDDDGITIEANQLTPNDGTITDAAGNTADLKHSKFPSSSGQDNVIAQGAFGAFSQSLQSQQSGSHNVDAVKPTISSVAITSTAPSSGFYRTGDKIQTTVTFSEVVNVTGTPQLTLKIGTGYKPATYKSGTGTEDLFFEYAVASGDSDTDGIAIEANALNNGPIKDTAGNLAILTNTVLGTQTAHKVDATLTNDPNAKPVQPTVSSVGLTSRGPYGVWDNITVKVTTTAPVMVTGSPTVAVIIGNREKRANYQSGSGSAALVFQYTVASGDGDDPNGISVKANSLTGGTIKDTASNTLTLNPNHPALPDQGVAHQVDTTAPQISSLAFTSTGPYGIGGNVQVTATMSEPITVTGVPSLKLLIGSTERTASYQSGTGSAALVFQYTIVAADPDDADGVSVKANSLALNSGTLVDAAGNALRLTHSSVNGGATHAVGVTISGISSVAFTSTGPYKLKDVITLTVTTAETATVTGTPRIRMTVGRRMRYADYVSGSGSTGLIFQYTVVAGDADADGIELSQNALRNYRGSAIKNSRQTDVNLSHAGIEASTTHIVDTTQPEITAVAFATEGPTVYTTGSTIEVLVTFAETGVQVTSGGSGAVPSLSLLFGSNSASDAEKVAVEALYKETRPGSTKLVFAYTVTAATPVDADGVQVKKSSLKLPAGAAITDPLGNVIEATPTEDGGSLIDIRPASKLSSRPILPAITSTGIIFNEFMNAKTDKQDWVELRNTTENEVSLSGWKLNVTSRGSMDSEVLPLPDTTIPASGVLLLVNTMHKDNRLERSDAYTYRYFLMPKLLLRGSDFSLILRERSGALADMVGTHFPNAETSEESETRIGFSENEAYFREQPNLPGYELAAWQPSGYQGGLGYDRKAGQHVSLGTPGYLQATLGPQGETASISISEIMFTPGKSQNLPQWIELYNESKTEVVTVQGWRFQMEVYDPNSQPTHNFITLVIQKALRILPNQTVLVVTKGGRNSRHFPDQRVYNLAEYNPNKIQQLGQNIPLMRDTGYAIVLRDESGNLVDVVGNLDGNNNTREEPSWKMLNCITPKGFRTSIIRQYERGKALDGTVRSSWFQATDIRRTVVTYWGHPKDKGNPGWKKGGPLPVQLSSFKAARADQGAVIQWTTESELENAGFNVLRSDSRTGTFKVITPRMLPGAGTTSERSTYAYIDTTAKEGIAYYYRLEEVSFEGVRQPIVTRRLRGHVSAGNRYLTTFGDMKKAE